MGITPTIRAVSHSVATVVQPTSPVGCLSAFDRVACDPPTAPLRLRAVLSSVAAPWPAVLEGRNGVLGPHGQRLGLPLVVDSPRFVWSGSPSAPDTPTSRCGFCLQDVGVVPAPPDRAPRAPSIEASDRLTEVRERCKIAYLPVRASPWASAERATATSLPGYMTAVTHLRAT